MARAFSARGVSYPLRGQKTMILTLMSRPVSFFCLSRPEAGRFLRGIINTRDGADVMEVRREHARGKIIRYGNTVIRCEDEVIQKENKVIPCEYKDPQAPQRSSLSTRWQGDRAAERAGFKRARASSDDTSLSSRDRQAKALPSSGLRISLRSLHIEPRVYPRDRSSQDCLCSCGGEVPSGLGSPAHGRDKHHHPLYSLPDTGRGKLP